MAKYCKHCGTKLEEGQVCTCAQAQAELAAPAAPAPEAAAPVATAAPAAAPAGNGFVKKLLDTLKGYWKAPKEAAAAVAEDKQGMAVAGVFAGVNFLAVFFFLWRMLGQLINIIASAIESVGEAFTGMMGIMGSIMGSMMGSMGDLGDLAEMGEAMEELEIAWPIMPLLISGLVIAALGIAISALVVFVAAKINKQSIDFKGLILTQSVHTITPSALLIVGLVLSLISWELQVLVLALILIHWFINIFTEVRDTANMQAMESGKTMTIQALVVAAALAVAVFAISKLFGWCVEEYFGAFVEAIQDAMTDGLSDMLGDLLG